MWVRPLVELTVSLSSRCTAEGNRIFLSIENGQFFFSTEYMASGDFSERNALFPNIPFSLFPNFGSGSPPGRQGVSR